MSKSQIAVETLLAYSFVMLMIAAVFVAISYFGLFDVGSTIPEVCQFSHRLSCIDRAAIKNNGIEFALKNNVGTNILVLDVNSNDCVGDKGGVSGIENTITTNNDFQAFNVSKDELFRLKVDCNLDSSGFDGIFSVSYLNRETGLSNIEVGDIKGRVI